MQQQPPGTYVAEIAAVDDVPVPGLMLWQESPPEGCTLCLLVTDSNGTASTVPDDASPWGPMIPNLTLMCYRKTPDCLVIYDVARVNAPIFNMSWVVRYCAAMHAMERVAEAHPDDYTLTVLATPRAVRMHDWGRPGDGCRYRLLHRPTGKTLEVHEVFALPDQAGGRTFGHERGTGFCETTHFRLLSPPQRLQ